MQGRSLKYRITSESEFCVIPAVHGNASNLITSHTDRPSVVNLILPFDRLRPGLGDIRGKGKKKIPRNPLLNGNPRGWVSITAAYQWVDPETGYTCETLHSRTKPARSLRSKD